MPNIVTEVELPEGICRVSVEVNSTVIKQNATCVGMGLHRQMSKALCVPTSEGELECEGARNVATPTGFRSCDGEEECREAAGR